MLEKSLGVAVQERESAGLGIGARYLRALGEIFPTFDSTLNIIVNYACHGACRHCLARDLIEYQRGINMRLKPDEIESRKEEKRRNLMQVMKDFKGAPKAFLTGGEPFMEGKHIFPLINHAAECFDEVFVNTNALAIPLDRAQAEAFLMQMPSNVVLSISLDQYHVEVDSHLKERVRLCEILAAEGLCKTAYNIRIPKSGSWRPSKAREVLEEYNLEEKYEEDHKNFFIHEVAAVSSAHDLEMGDTVSLNPLDFIAHTERPDSITMFLTPEGEFVNSNHAAFMVPPRPKISVVGNMFEEGVEAVLRKLAQDYFDYAKNPEACELFDQLLSGFSDIRGKTKLRNGLNSHMQEIMGMRMSRVVELVLQERNIRWELPMQASIDDFIATLPDEKRGFLFSDAVDQYLAAFADGHLPESEWSGMHRITIDNGQPRFIYLGKHEKSIDLNGYWHKTVRYLLEFGRILGVGRQDFFQILCQRLSLEKKPESLEELMAHLWNRYYELDPKKHKIIFNEAERALRGEEPVVTGLYPGDRKEASNWFQDLVYTNF